MPSPFRLILCLGITAAIAVPSASAGIFDDPRNLKVLPEDISPQDLRRTMRGFSLDLGLDCRSCHVGEADQPIETYDFAADEKDLKHAARLMLRMTAEINGRQLAELKRPPEERVAVSCATCHRGVSKPHLIGDELTMSYRKGGAAAAIARYRELKAEFFGSGSYDFTEAPRLQFADRLVSEKQVAGALEFLRDLRHEHGSSFMTDMKLGDLYFMNDDRGNAIASFEAAREAAPPPVRANIQQRIDGLKENQRNDD
jgi:hypothetical protein